MNVLTITGNLGKDVRLGNAGGTAVANFSVAAKAGYGDKEQTIWVDCALWGKQAESRLVDYLKKGQQVSVSGEMGTREHEGKTYITLRVNSVTLCGKRDDANVQPSTYGGGQNQQPPARNSSPQPAPAGGAAMDDDIPFAPVSSKIY